MKTKKILSIITIFFAYATTWAQTSYGSGAGANDPGHNSNSYFGVNAGNSNTGQWNTFIGHRSGENNTVSSQNTFVGNGSGFDHITGTYNTFLGGNSGHNNTEGDRNTFIGGESAWNHDIGSYNTFLGFQSGFNNDGSSNVFLGYRAGYNEPNSNKLYIDNSSTSSPLIWGDFAADALRFYGSVRITDIDQNDALTHVLVEDTDGDIHWRDATTLNTDTQTLIYDDVAQTLYITNGNSVDLSSLTAGGLTNFPSYPVSAGDGGDNTNAYFGYEAGISNTGAANTFIGRNSGYGNSTGAQNTFLGAYSGQGNTTGSNNVYIGHHSGPATPGSTDNKLYIDNQANDTPLIWGDFDNDLLNFNGDVTIGDVTIPGAGGYKLYVESGILTEKVKIAVDGTADWGWPDYVFEEDYKLKALPEVETFIKKNKHLPGIPSASAVEKEGIDVAQMDAKLLEKIEELTLYVIQMNKRVDQLEKENIALKKNIKN